MKIRQIVVAFLLVAVAWAQTPSGYEYGLFLLDRHEWEQATQEFDRVAAKAGAQADAALYWKAYALNKAVRPTDALAALAVLRKSYPMSRWLQDVAALEMELKRAAGEHLTPESQSDEELKLLALNALARTDPERAVPAIEGILKQSRSPLLKREALYVLAQNASPKAQQLMEQVARGKVNPDLQLLAVRYMVEQRPYRGNLGQLLFEIYNSTGNPGVKQEIVMGLATIGDVAHLSQIPTDVAQAAAANNSVFQQRLGLMLTVEQQQARLEAEKAAVPHIVADYLSQKDRAVKQGIIDAYQKNAPALIAIARMEIDPYFKKRIVEHLIDLNTPEAREYLLEILK